MSDVPVLHGAQLLAAPANILVPGLYAWATTVAAPAFSDRGSLASRLAAGAAAGALLVGPLLVQHHPRAGRAVGILVFGALCVASWALGGRALGVTEVDPIRAALGALGWALFAFGWGAVRLPMPVSDQDVESSADGRPLLPRGALPPAARLIFAVSLIGGVAPMLVAWRVARPEQGLLGHAVATLCAIAMVTAGAHIALERPARRVFLGPRNRVVRAARPLVLVMLLVAVGVLWRFLR